MTIYEATVPAPRRTRSINIGDLVRTVDEGIYCYVLERFNDGRLMMWRPDDLGMRHVAIESKLELIRPRTTPPHPDTNMRLRNGDRIWTFDDREYTVEDWTTATVRDDGGFGTRELRRAQPYLIMHRPMMLGDELAFYEASDYGRPVRCVVIDASPDPSRKVMRAETYEREPRILLPGDGGWHRWVHLYNGIPITPTEPVRVEAVDSRTGRIDPVVTSAIAKGDIAKGAIVSFVKVAEIPAPTKEDQERVARDVLRQGLARFLESPNAVAVLERALFESDPEVIAFVHERSEAKHDTPAKFSRYRAVLDQAWEREEPAGARLRARVRAAGLIGSLHGNPPMGALDPVPVEKPARDLFPAVKVPKRRHWF